MHAVDACHMTRDAALCSDQIDSDFCVDSIQLWRGCLVAWRVYDSGSPADVYQQQWSIEGDSNLELRNPHPLILHYAHA